MDPSTFWEGTFTRPVIYPSYTPSEGTTMIEAQLPSGNLT
jgi:hypothetical protein